MIKKQVSIRVPKKDKKPEKIQSDQWVENRHKVKRLTFDVPIELHIDLKVLSAKSGMKMNEIAITAIKKYIDNTSS